MKREVVIGRFDREGPVIDAVRAIRALGLRVVDVYSPYPIHRMDDALGIERSRLPFAALAGGVAGLIGALALELYTSVVDWPLNIGGKPDASVLAFIPIAFELTILGAGLSTAAGLLLRARLAPFRPARLVDASATDDRFAVVVQCRDTAFDHHLVEQLMLNYGAQSVDSARRKP